MRYDVKRWLVFELVTYNLINNMLLCFIPYLYFVLAFPILYTCICGGLNKEQSSVHAYMLLMYNSEHRSVKIYIIY